MVDRSQLIAEIHSRPPLWDLHSEEYKSRANLPQLWKEVAARMGPDVTVDECKRKWKNLRDAYRAEIKRIDIRIKNDILKCVYDPNKDYNSKWVYFKQMQFIKDIKGPQRTKRSVNSSSNNNYDDDVDDLERFAEFRNIENIKLEADLEMETGNSYLLSDVEATTDSGLYRGKIVKETEKQNQCGSETLVDSKNLAEKAEKGKACESETYSEQLLKDKDDFAGTEMQSEKTFKESQKLQMQEQEAKLLQQTPKIKINLSLQNSLSMEEKDTDNKAVYSCFQCGKRCRDKMEYPLDDLQRELNPMKSARLDIINYSHLAHGDSNYNFLISYLPKLDMMNDLQNLQFRAKMSELVFSIMNQSQTDSVMPSAMAF